MKGGVYRMLTFNQPCQDLFPVEKHFVSHREIYCFKALNILFQAAKTKCFNALN